MNAHEKNLILQHLTQAIDKALEKVTNDESLFLPLMGEATPQHMAIAALNVLEAVENLGQYIGGDLDDETRDSLGL